MAGVAVQIDPLRPKLAALAKDPDPYPFLSLVEDYLAAVPDDHPLRASALAALVKKGLFSVAVELARACPPSGPEGAELRAVAEQLARAPREIVPWPTTNARFEANLDALRGRGPADDALAASLEQAWRKMAPELTLHQANDGNVQVRGKRSDGRPIWIPPPLDYAGAVEAIPDAEFLKGDCIAPFLLDGVGMGGMVPRLHEATRCQYLNYSPALYIVETNLRALALALRLHDWTVALADERVYLFAGPAAWDAWRDLMKAELWLPLAPEPTPTIRWPGHKPDPAKECLEEVAAYRDSLRDALHERADAVYAGRDAAFWADRFETAEPRDPLHVLCITSRYSTFLQHSMRDLAAALERAGLLTRLMIEAKDHAVVPPQTYMETFIEFRPDLVVLIDHHRHERPQMLIDQVPLVCWIQDELPYLFEADVGRRLGPLDFTIGFGLRRCVLQHGYPVERFMPCQLAIDPAKFAPPAHAGEPDPALRCDVAYVSHHSESPEALHARLRAQAGNDDGRRLMDVFYEETRSLFAGCRFNGGYDLDRLVCDAEAKAGLAVSDPAMRAKLMMLYVRPLADRSLRHATLAWAADWAEAAGRTLHLYGNGWDRNRRFARYAKGRAEHGRHLGEIVRGAAINLHTGLNTALHQRVLETVGAGGFLMVRYHPFDFYRPAYDSLLRCLRERRINRPTGIPLGQLPPDYVEMLRETSALTAREVPEALDVSERLLLDLRLQDHYAQRGDYANLALPDFDRITFDGPEAFARQAEWFLAHPDEHQAIARRMQAAVNELFTYDALTSRIIRFLTEALQSQAGKEVAAAGAAGREGVAE